MFEMMGMYELNPAPETIDFMANVVCTEDARPEICANILFMQSGFDPDQMNLTLVETILNHTPAGGSTRTIIHYSQQYNYGSGILLNIMEHVQLYIM